jgi:predicted nucleotidyltransferase
MGDLVTGPRRRGQPGQAADGPIAGVSRTSIRSVAAAHHVTRLMLFGSWQSGAATSDSDIDLLVEMASGSTLFDVIRLREALTRLTGRRVDVITLGMVSGPLRERIGRSARPL